MNGPNIDTDQDRRTASADAEARRPYPDSPILATVHRGDGIESVHRGAWCLVDSSGEVREGAGPVEHPFFARSSVKCMQVLPLLETGAAERFGVTEEEIALAVSSHNAEPCHVAVAEGLLGRLGLDEHALGCGPQAPGDPEARRELAERGGDLSRIHNNCSGKHAGFLALARHVGGDVADYLDFDSPSQVLVRDAVAELTGLSAESLGRAIDGCSAPTFRTPLTALATGFARIATPAGLAPDRRAAAERVVAAVERHPVLLAGRHKRLCTALAKVSRGTLFPKIGAEAVYAVGIPGRDLALAVKIDDGGLRGLHAVVVELLRRLGFLDEGAAEALASYRQSIVRNWAGLDVGRIDVHLG